MNVKDILTNAGIDFTTSGKNISRDHIGLACPFCNREGNADPSHHLGIHVETGHWSCWRNASHHGTLSYLLKELLHVKLSDAKTLIDTPQVLTSDFRSTVYNKINGIDTKALKYLTMPADFVSIKKKTRATNYLIQRGFPARDHEYLADYYDLRFSTVWPWENRLIFPIYEHNKLLTWTGRSIYNTIREKYKNLNNEDSLISLKDSVWNYDELFSRKNSVLYQTIYLCEGPFDALKIDFYSKINVSAMPIFGLTVSDRQLAKLSNLKFTVKVILDCDAEMKAIKLKHRLSNLNPQIVFLPRSVKDPGNMGAKQIHDFFV